METFVISDLHINHYNSILHDRREQWIIPNPKFDETKPWHFKHNNHEATDLERHDNDICDYWNETVNKNDEVIVIGDFIWKKHAHFISRLNGTKYLVRGNHDKMPHEVYRLFKQIEGSHYRYNWFTKIYGQQVMFSHTPYRTWFSSHHGSWNLHGHCHGRLYEIPHSLQIDCSLCLWNYRPIHWSVIQKVMSEKIILRHKWIEEHKSEEDDDNPSTTRLRNFRVMKEMDVKHLPKQ